MPNIHSISLGVSLTLILSALQAEILFTPDEAEILWTANISFPFRTETIRLSIFHFYFNIHPYVHP